MGQGLSRRLVNDNLFRVNNQFRKKNKHIIKLFLENNKKFLKKQFITHLSSKFKKS